MRCFFFVIAFFVSITAMAQESIINDIDNNLLAKYIASAKQNFPRVKALKAREDIARYQVTATQMQWFDIINAGYYYRPENTSGKGENIGGTVTPSGQLITSGFMFGASINLGSLLSRPAVVKSARASYKASVAESEEYDITLATEVKSRYYDFLVAKKQLAIRNLSAQNLKGLLIDAQQKYEKGEIPIDVYTASKNAATEAAALALTSEVAYLKSKDALEDIVGTKLETIK